MMGVLLGSPHVAPLFLGLFGSYGVPFQPATCRPNGFGPPHRHRRRAIVDLVTRSQNTGRRNRASGIFPRFLPRGRSHRLRTIDGNDRLFGGRGESYGWKRLVEGMGPIGDR